MPLTPPGYSVENIQGLADLTKDQATAVKVLFDKTGADTKTFLVDTMIPELNALDVANVKKTGDQTIAGVKTFSSSPVVPTPTTDMQASTKKYVDDNNTAQTGALATHKLTATADHDGRYYTESETDGFTTKLTGDQTIAGVKTFSASPIVPTPTTATQAANKSYVDGQSPLTIGNGSITDLKLSNAVGDIKERFTSYKAETANYQVSIEKFPRIIPETNDAPRLQRAIDSISTVEFTEAIPTVGVMGKVIVPAGRFAMNTKVVCPSYVKVEGAGRHATIFDSNITNGDPVFEVTEPTTGGQQFLNSLEGFTINGGHKTCRGITIKQTSRWVLRDIAIDGTEYEGLYITSAFLGELYSCQIRACGDATHSSVLLTNEVGHGGSHAVTFFGGEINGGTGTSTGLYLNSGTSVAAFGLTVEGFRDGPGIINNIGNSFTVSSCYFEENKEHILEIGSTLGTNYINNFFGPISAGARGHIGITFAQGATIAGNYFQGSADVKIFDATSDSTGKLQISYVRDSYAPAYPINISASLVADAKIHGTTIEAYSGNNRALIYGDRTFKDSVEFTTALKVTGGIIDISGATRSNITAGPGTPESVKIADPGSIHMRDDGASDNSLYIKKGGPNNAAGWLPVQLIQTASTASRPVVTQAGFMLYDTTLNKPVWWNGVTFKDITDPVSGASGARPATGLLTGQTYYDTTLSKPIWWSGAAWKDAMGTTV